MIRNIGGVNYECYPLTSAQKVHIYTLNFSPTQEIVNIGSGAYVQMELNVAALREALNRAVERCESMRMRIMKDPETGESFQYIVPYQNEYFEYYDFSAWDESRVDEVFRKWTSQPFDTYGGKLSRIVIVSLPNGYNGFYYNVHHACMDSGSVIAFSHDVFELYCALLYGMPYPKPMTSYIESVKQDLAYEGSKKQAKDRAYWMKTLELPEPMYTDFTGPGRLMQQRREANDPDRRWGVLSTKDGSGSTITYDLDVESTRKILDFAKEYQIPVSVVLLHAIRTVLCKFNDLEEDICIRDFVSRRSTLLHKKCGGVRMHCYPLRTIMPVTTTVLESMRMLKKAQDEMFIHADFGTLEYAVALRKAYGGGADSCYHSINFTYQPGTLNGLVPALEGIGFKSYWYTSGKQPQPMYITAMHRPGDGGLTFFFGYQTDCATPEEIEFLYYFTGRVLFRSIENPDKTIKDIIDMT